MAKTETNSQYEYKFKKDYEADLETHDNYIADFDAYEAMLIGQVYDSTSKTVNKSSITDSYASTLAIERSARVVGKLPDGKFEPAAKKDTGKAMFLDILIQKWVYPNANSQHPFFTKIRMWQLYSSVYGYMPMFYDWNVANSGYVGPDCWLWNPRNLIPQKGRVSIEDMDYVTALSWVSEKSIDNWIKAGSDAGWNVEALRELKDLVEKDKSVSGDNLRDTKVERTRTPNDSKQGVCVATRYESGADGEWVSFTPDHGCLEIRRVKNPHKNGRIPFVIKYSQPLFDSFYGMGDFQRAKPLQFARDGLTNFYFSGIKMNLLPPIVANANGVQPHTLDYRPGGVILETIPNSVRRLETSTAGLATYQAAQSQLTGSLLSMYGSQNASIPGADALNPSQGKTPQAIDMYSDKEATRDGQERAFLEQSIEKLADGFVSLISNIGTEGIPINLFSEEIDDLTEQGYDDLLEMFQPNETGDAASYVFEPTSLRGSEFRFNINPGTTAEVSQAKQRDQVLEVISTLAKFQNILKEDPSVQMNWGKMVQTYQNLTSVKGIEEFVTIIPPEVLQAQQEEQMAMQAQMTAEAQVQEQQKLAPAATSVRGTLFKDPTIGQAAQQLTEL